MRNWIYYMQEGLKNMWKKKEVPDYRRETRVVDDAGVDIKTGKYVGDPGGGKKKKEYKTVTDEVKFNKEGVVHKNHPFTEREFDGAFKECGCLPDCGCKE